MALDLGFDTEKIKSGYLKLPDYQKVLITFVVMAAIGGLYFYFLYMPKQKELASLRPKLAKMQSDLSQSRAVADDLPRFESEAKELNEKLARALKQLPSSDEIPRLLKDMESLGKESGVEFKSLRLLKDVPRDFYAEVPVDLKLSGGYHDTAVFYDKLSNLPRIINVSNLSFGSPKDVAGKIVLDISCRATTFKFLEKEKGKK